MVDLAGWAAILTAIAALITAIWQSRKAALEARSLRRATNKLGEELHPGGAGGSVREAIDRIERNTQVVAGEVRAASEDTRALRGELREEVHGLRRELRADRAAVHLLRVELEQLREQLRDRFTSAGGPLARLRRRRGPDP